MIRNLSPIIMDGLFQMVFGHASIGTKQNGPVKINRAVRIFWVEFD
jgi:hypothetical protein